MLQGKDILVVDDSHEFSFLLSSLLKVHSVNVESIDAPDTAYETLKNSNYDLLVVDYLMEPYNGLELIERARELSNHRETKVILVTAKKLENDELQELKRLGGVYLSKPILPNEFYKRITDLLEK